MKKMTSRTQIVPAVGPGQMEIIRALFREYAASAGDGFCFKGFEEELAGLPGEYAPPGGLLYLALVKGEPAGCLGMRKIGEDICEMKRLYVRPLYRGQGIGRKLARELVKEARKLGYSRIRLDTMPYMKRARALYYAMGFKPIDSYRPDPVPGALCFELKLL
jgi:putative acetyltransferase